MQNVAQFLRRYPWIVSFALKIWRLGRPRFTAGVVGVVVNAQGQVLLVEHVFHPKIPWGLPGGWVDRAEDLESTLIREMQEELMLNVTINHVLLVEINPKVRNHMDIVFLCTPQGDIGTLSSELLGYQWVSVDDLPPIPAFHQRAIQRFIASQPNR